MGRRSESENVLTIPGSSRFCLAFPSYASVPHELMRRTKTLSSIVTETENFKSHPITAASFVIVSYDMCVPELLQ